MTQALLPTQEQAVPENAVAPFISVSTGVDPFPDYAMSAACE